MGWRGSSAISANKTALDALLASQAPDKNLFERGKARTIYKNFSDKQHGIIPHQRLSVFIDRTLDVIHSHFYLRVFETSSIPPLAFPSTRRLCPNELGLRTIERNIVPETSILSSSSSHSECPSFNHLETRIHSCSSVPRTTAGRSDNSSLPFFSLFS